MTPITAAYLQSLAVMNRAVLLVGAVVLPILWVQP